MPRGCGATVWQGRARSSEAAAGGVQGEGSAHRGAGGGVGAGGGGAGWAAAPAPLQPLPLGRGGRGARRLSSAIVGAAPLGSAALPSTALQSRARPTAAVSATAFASVAGLSSPPPAPRVRRGRGAGCRLLLDCTGCAAAAERVLDCAGRPRPSRGSRRQREGALTGAGVATVRASHLQLRWPAPGSAERIELGFPLAGTAGGHREACSPGKWDTNPSLAGRETCGNGPGRAGKVASWPQVSAAGPGVRWVPSCASAWRVLALCHPRAAGTRTHPRRLWLAARPFSRRGEGGAGEVGGRAAAGELQVRCRSRTQRPAFALGWGRGRALL